MIGENAIYQIFHLISIFRDSVNDISGYKRPKLPGAKNGPKQGGKNKRNQRMGKMRRQKSKHGKK